MASAMDGDRLRHRAHFQGYLTERGHDGPTMPSDRTGKAAQLPRSLYGRRRSKDYPPALLESRTVHPYGFDDGASAPEGLHQIVDDA